MARRRPSPHAHGRSEVRERSDLRILVAAEQDRLGTRLRRIRQKQGVTQEEAAERAGVHPKHLQRVEGGKVNVTIATLVAISQAYGLKLKGLF